jgi:uncharacterized protein (TIGR02147 family)
MLKRIGLLKFNLTLKNKSMSKNVFDFDDYKLFILESIDEMPARGRGAKTALANAMGCQAAYLSQVLGGSAQLSSEQALASAQFFKLSAEETEIFVNLVNIARAGNGNLRNFYDRILTRQKLHAKRLKQKLNLPRSISKFDQAIYYGSWHYSAVHMAILVSRLQTLEALHEALGIPMRKLQSVLTELVKMGILEQNGIQFRSGKTAVHLDKDSDFIRRHHENWRLRAISSMDEIQPQDLHYSGVITCSKADLARVKDLLETALNQSISTVLASKEETVSALNIDLFSLEPNKTATNLNDEPLR